MTQTFAPGYPDFQDQAQWQSNIVLTDTRNYLGGADVVFPVGGGSFNVSNWESILVGVAGLGGDTEVQLTWAAPPTQLTVSRVFVSAAGNIDQFVAPNYAPNLTVTVSNLSAATSSVTLTLSMLNGLPAPGILAETGTFTLLSLTGASIPANATSTFTAGRSAAGVAWFAATIPFGSPTTVRLQFLDLTDTWRTMAAWSTGDPDVGAHINQLVVLPPAPVRVSVSNGSAAAQPFTCALIADDWRS